MKITSLIFIVLIGGSLLSQNLVLNPSFEDFYDCPKAISFFHRNVKNWTIPNNSTTDYYNSCSESVGYDNFIGFQVPKAGNGFAGIYVFQNGNYREYIQGKLSKSLERDKIYEISFYVSLAENSSHAIKNFQILFTLTKLTSYTSENVDLERLSNQVTFMKSVQFTNDNFITDTTNWRKLSLQYKAFGFESYFTIGNFKRNSKSEKFKIKSKKGKSASYYYVDDVSIEPIEKEEPKEITLDKTEPISFENNKTYTFENVLFDFDKSELLDISKFELDKLSEYLKNNQNINIEIYGHTDTIGTQKWNDELSLERAKSVSDYLILQGLDTSKIKWVGFGSSKPVSTNETEEGRAQNRRVEFMLTSE